jgi:dTDP-4-dehydrorhamnose 3,5-epimerase
MTRGNFVLGFLDHLALELLDLPALDADKMVMVLLLDLVTRDPVIESTFGRHVAMLLSADNFNQLWIPAGFAHGFCVISETAQLQYKCTDVYDPSSELTIAWDDPAIGIDWPLENPLLSDKDRMGRPLADIALQDLPVYADFNSREA